MLAKRYLRASLRLSTCHLKNIYALAKHYLRASLMLSTLQRGAMVFALGVSAGCRRWVLALGVSGGCRRWC